DAKCLLFDNSKKIIINADDKWGRTVAERYSHKDIVTFSAHRDETDYTAKNITFTQNSVKFLMVGKGSINRVDFPMPGEYSVHNAMGAALAVAAVGFTDAQVSKALCNVKGVKGRCEILVKDPFTVICDYAHTADGLENILSSLRPFVKEKMIVLFGCPGERDRTKRVPMAEAVAKYADFVVLTSDNPRKEDPQEIMESVKGYFDEKNIPYIAEVDRRKAINMALNMLQYNETLVLCGKGHEDYQVLNGITVYLDEHEIVAKFMDRYNRGK
ncbi:MAG: UDP-N-acetylmuramoyl-L-alanyl-D-glutamate--2,6-diaminopimelate ligase, partial [Oscillospiraceae bacterium]|nr:UDP-N-acetylmuramoyl-L-alanyl-D-glutamate--2,6-diaminopimelate ligase [Oscillospiraceae bacterium]